MAILLIGVLPASPVSAAAVSPAADTGYLAIDVGWGIACVLRDDGTIGCWGSWTYNSWDHTGTWPSQLPAGAFTAIGVAMEDGYDADGAVDAGVCGLRPDGSRECTRGRVSPGPYVMVEDPHCAIRVGGALDCGSSAPDGAFVRVSSAPYDRCGIREDGTLACWGGWDDRLVPPEGEFTEITVVDGYACGLNVDQGIECWGSVGELAMPPDGTFVAVSVARDLRGAEHGCGLRTDGTLACWGAVADAGVARSGTFKSFAAGPQADCAITTTDTIICWGDDAFRPAPYVMEPSVPEVATTGRVPVRWEAIAGPTRVVSYDVRAAVLPRHPDDSRWDWDRELTGTTATSARFAQTFGRTTCFQVRARDAEGHASRWSIEACAVAPLDDRALARSTGWTALRDSRFFRGTALRTSVRGATLTWHGLAGDELGVVVSRCRGCGAVAVYADGRLLGRVWLNRSFRRDKDVVWLYDDQYPHYSATWRTVKVVVISTGQKVLLDGLIVSEPWEWSD